MSRAYQRRCVPSWSPYLHWTTSEPLPDDLVQAIGADTVSACNYVFHHKYADALDSYFALHGFIERFDDSSDGSTWQPLSNFSIQVVSDGKAWQTDKHGCTDYRDRIRLVFTPKADRRI